jgi:hypothetical protein
MSNNVICVIQMYKPEVFPISFVGNVVENIMRFMKSPVLSIDDSIENV